MKNTVCIVLFFILLGASSAFAVPASPFPMKVTQPDGTVLELYRKGDEACNWVETSDGYSVINNPENGYWEYAQTSLQALEFFPSGVVAEKGVQPPAHIKKGIAPVSFVPYGPPQPTGVKVDVAETVLQPDGKSIVLVWKTSAGLFWRTTHDGYPVAKNPRTGFWEYAVREPVIALVPSRILYKPGGEAPRVWAKHQRPTGRGRR